MDGVLTHTTQEVYIMSNKVEIFVKEFGEGSRFMAENSKDDIDDYQVIAISKDWPDGLVVAMGMDKNTAELMCNWCTQTVTAYLLTR